MRARTGKNGAPAAATPRSRRKKCAPKARPPVAGRPEEHATSPSKPASGAEAGAGVDPDKPAPEGPEPAPPRSDEDAKRSDRHTAVDEEGRADGEDDAGHSGSDEPSAGVDTMDSRAMEAELDGLISHLTNDGSKLALARLLPRAKKLYEDMHPETKHGGLRADQVTNSRTWPPFAEFVAQRAGIAASTVYAKLKEADALGGLDAVAEERCYGTALANQIGMVKRIARIPQKQVQRDLVNVYRNAGRKEAKKQLAKWENAFKLGKPTPDRDHGATTLHALVMKLGDILITIQKFFCGMPVAPLLLMLAKVLEAYVRTGETPTADVEALLARHALHARLETLKEEVAKDTDVGKAAAGKPFRVSASNLDAAIANPKLRAKDVEALEAAWAQAAERVAKRSPIEETLGTRKGAKAAKSPRVRTTPRKPKGPAVAKTSADSKGAAPAPGANGAQGLNGIRSVS